VLGCQGQLRKDPSPLPLDFPFKIGINRATATAEHHGPTARSGMNVFDLETEQAVEHTKRMVSHLWKDDEVGRMLQTTIDQLQIQAGT
jgi:hypothetical protein